MDDKDQERRHVVAIIGAGLIAALVAWLAVPSAAQAQAAPTTVATSAAAAAR